MCIVFVYKITLCIEIVWYSCNSAISSIDEIRVKMSECINQCLNMADTSAYVLLVYSRYVWVCVISL